jgi:predicted AAA+ superfamily ATPase
VSRSGFCEISASYRKSRNIAVCAIDSINFVFQRVYAIRAAAMNDPATRERELAPLRSIRDNYEKLVIAGNCAHPVTQDGIRIVILTDFLLDG